MHTVGVVLYAVILTTKTSRTRMHCEFAARVRDGAASPPRPPS